MSSHFLLNADVGHREAECSCINHEEFKPAILPQWWSCLQSGKIRPKSAFSLTWTEICTAFLSKRVWPNAANGTKNCVCGGELRVKNANKRTNKNTLVVEKSSYTVFHYLVKHKRTHWGVRIFFLFFFLLLQLSADTKSMLHEWTLKNERHFPPFILSFHSLHADKLRHTHAHTHTCAQSRRHRGDHQ